MKPPRIPAWLRAELDACGLPWSVERGAKHLHVLICGRLAHVHSHRPSDAPSRAPAILAIRRMAQAIKLSGKGALQQERIRCGT